MSADARARGPSPPRLGGVLEAAVYGADLALLERFYADVLGMEAVARTEGRNIVMRCGHSVVILFDPAVSDQPGGMIPHHGARGPGHVALVAADEDIGRWRGRLRALGIAIETEIDWPGAGTSLYVRDPAGNSIEIAPASLWNGIGRAMVRPD